MFTKQSGQIENALRGGGLPATSAREMMQGLANCQAPLEHRGGAAFTRNPRDNRNLFPGPMPTGGGPGFYVPPSIIDRRMFVSIPPWQNVPWEPIPYPDQEQWQPIPYPEWPGDQYPGDDLTVIINGPTYMGPVSTTDVTTNNLNSTTINNAGDIINQNAFINQGPVVNNGPVTHNHNVVNHQQVINKRTVVNEGDVFNNGTTYNANTNNYNTQNYGGSTTYGPTFVQRFYSSGPNFFGGDTTFEANIFVINPADPSGPPMTMPGGLAINLVTDVEWDGTALKKKYRTVTLLGSQGVEQTATVVSGTSCPATPLNASAGNLVDMP